VLDWFDAIPPDAGEAFMKEAFRGTLAVATQRGPNLAVPWWEKRQHEPYAVESVWVIPSLWIPQAPDAAIEWAMNLPSSPENNTALQTGIRRWYELDKGAAARWLASHPIPERFLAKLPKPVKKTIRQLRRAR
jgi:hypothetical protein